VNYRIVITGREFACGMAGLGERVRCSNVDK
jgi:hypothetical protein